MTERAGRLSLLAAVAGAALASQARVNGALRTRLGDAVVAALVSFGAGLVVLLVAAVASGRWRGARRLRTGTRWWWWLGGLAGALLVATSAAAVPEVGVALTGVAIVAGATTGSLVVDRLGISPRGRQPLTPPRLAGSLLAIVGLLVGTVGQSGEVRPLLLTVVGIAGFGTAVQQAANAHLQRASGEVLVAASVSFLVGTAALLLAVLVSSPSGLRWPRQPRALPRRARGSGVHRARRVHGPPDRRPAPHARHRGGADGGRRAARRVRADGGRADRCVGRGGGVHRRRDAGGQPVIRRVVQLYAGLFLADLASVYAALSSATCENACG